jgi:GntR family transcriptional regulator, transcriptional repressor for pyruvate dehydrogenase complex
MKKLEFESLKIRRATDIIENRISNMIIKGTLACGEKLPTEKQLSDQFNVSIVTIREAMRGLEVTGLIVKKRGRGGGVYVTELNNDSIKTAFHNFLRRREFSAHQLAQVRVTIEPTIVRLAVSEITPGELSALEETVTGSEEVLKKAAAMQPKDYALIGHNSLEFHRLIAQATHNPVFALTMDYLLDFISYFKKSPRPEIALHSRIVVDHRSIFDALKQGEAGEAESRMRKHLESVESNQMNEGT